MELEKRGEKFIPLYKKKKSSLKEWEVSIVYLEEKVYLCRYKPNKKRGTDGKTN